MATQVKERSDILFPNKEFRQQLDKMGQVKGDALIEFVNEILKDGKKGNDLIESESRS